MIRFTRNKRYFLYLTGLISSLFTIPLGNAIKDWGIIHILGIIIFLFVLAGVFWEFYGKDRPGNSKMD